MMLATMMCLESLRIGRDCCCRESEQKRCTLNSVIHHYTGERPDDHTDCNLLPKKNDAI